MYALCGTRHLMRLRANSSSCWCNGRLLAIRCAEESCAQGPGEAAGQASAAGRDVQGRRSCHRHGSHGGAGVHPGRLHLSAGALQPWIRQDLLLPAFYELSRYLQLPFLHMTDPAQSFSTGVIASVSMIVCSNAMADGVDTLYWLPQRRARLPGPTGRTSSCLCCRRCR